MSNQENLKEIQEELKTLEGEGYVISWEPRGYDKYLSVEDNFNGLDRRLARVEKNSSETNSKLIGLEDTFYYKLSENNNNNNADTSNFFVVIGVMLFFLVYTMIKNKLVNYDLQLELGLIEESSVLSALNDYRTIISLSVAGLLVFFYWLVFIA